MPTIIATAVDVIWITGFNGSPNFNDKPPIPKTRIVAAINKFLVSFKSIF